MKLISNMSFVRNFNPKGAFEIDRFIITLKGQDEGKKISTFIKAEDLI